MWKITVCCCYCLDLCFVNVKQRPSLSGTTVLSVYDIGSVCLGGEAILVINVYLC